MFTNFYRPRSGFNPTIIFPFAFLVAAGIGSAHAETDSLVGVFTAAQAERGKTVFAGECAGCHGADLKGGTAPALSGEAFAASWGAEGNNAQVMGQPFSVDDLAFFVSTSMPPGKVKSVSAEDHAAALAYLLERNGMPAGDTPLELGAPQLKEVMLSLGRPVPEQAAPPPELMRGEPGAIPTGGGPSQAELNAAATATESWLYHTHDYAGSRYVPLDQVNAGNANQLEVACALQLGEMSTFQSGPIVYQGVMYVTTNTNTVALDATSCRVKWRHVWQMQGPPGWTNNRGVAIKDGWVVRGTSDGYLLALNAETGALVWARRVADSTQGETFTMPPLIYEDLILIGPAGSENGISGWIGAFKLDDGTPVWRFNTVPGASQPLSVSWGHQADIKVGGGAVWTPLTLDPDSGELHVAVTNPAPDLPADLRPGDNLYTNSVVALDVHSGKLLWYRQLVPNDDHDWDLTQAGPLFATSIGGKERRLLATAGKDGMLRVLDRESHEVLYATAVTTVKNAEAPVTPEGSYACPGVLGGVEWNGPAYNPATQMLYVGAVDWCTTFWAAQSIRFIPGRLYLGGSVQMDAESQGWITAVDAATGSVRWRYRSDAPMLAGVTTTSGGLVLSGESSGDFIALDAGTGEVRYRFNTGGGIGGGVVTYAVKGKQYIAVASGRPGNMFMNGTLGTPTLFVFALDD